MVRTLRLNSREEDIVEALFFPIDISPSLQTLKLLFVFSNAGLKSTSPVLVFNSAIPRDIACALSISS